MTHVVEIRGRLTGTDLFDMVHVTPATPGMNAVVTSLVDANGLVPGMVGYVGPTVQSVPLKRKEALTEADIDTGKLTFSQTMKGIIIVNESSTNTLTYTINGIPITLTPGEDDDGYYEEFTEVTITGTSPHFRAIGLG